MKIYVAGKNLERARKVMDLLIADGHTITFDWVADIENNEFPNEKAAAERTAVQEADLLIYLWESDQESARYETGMAMGLHKPIIVSGYPKDLLFFLSLPEVQNVKSDEDILGVLDSLN